MNQLVNLEDTLYPTAEIHGLSHDGRGIATIHGKTTFMTGALPTETCTYRIIKKRSHYNEAEALNILTPFSQQRTTPICKHFNICGGCSIQHMNFTAQMQLKQNTLLEQLKHFGKVTPETILPPLHAQSSEYRRKARLGVRYVIKKNKLLIGFREKAGRYLADIEHCPVLHPKIGEHLFALSELISSLEQYRHIPQIEVAIGDQDLALIFRHLQTLPDGDIKKLIAFGSKHGFHIYLQPNAPANINKIWPQDNNDRLTYTLPDYQLEFKFHPLDFTQVNLEINRLMVKQAIELLNLKMTDVVLDLFCGIGNFTLPISKYVHKVIGVEGNSEMVKRAQENAAHNQITNSFFYTANLIELPIQSTWSSYQYNKILLDPPRAGAKEILPLLNGSGVEKIIYVSCNPSTLARDAGELVHQYGYQLKQVGIMNMFPHTSHTEAMAVFDKL